MPDDLISSSSSSHLGSTPSGDSSNTPHVGRLDGHPSRTVNPENAHPDSNNSPDQSNDLSANIHNNEPTLDARSISPEATATPKHENVQKLNKLKQDVTVKYFLDQRAERKRGFSYADRGKRWLSAMVGVFGYNIGGYEADISIIRETQGLMDQVKKDMGIGSVIGLIQKTVRQFGITSMYVNSAMLILSAVKAGIQQLTDPNVTAEDFQKVVGQLFEQGKVLTQANFKKELEAIHDQAKTALKAVVLQVKSDALNKAMQANETLQKALQAASQNLDSAIKSATKDVDKAELLAAKMAQEVQKNANADLSTILTGQSQDVQNAANEKFQYLLNQAIGTAQNEAQKADLLSIQMIQVIKKNPSANLDDILQGQSSTAQNLAKGKLQSFLSDAALSATDQATKDNLMALKLAHQIQGASTTEDLEKLLALNSQSAAVQGKLQNLVACAKDVQSVANKAVSTIDSVRGSKLFSADENEARIARREAARALAFFGIDMLLKYAPKFSPLLGSILNALPWQMITRRFLDKAYQDDSQYVYRTAENLRSDFQKERKANNITGIIKDAEMEAITEAIQDAQDEAPHSWFLKLKDLAQIATGILTFAFPPAVPFMAKGIAASTIGYAGYKVAKAGKEKAQELYWRKVFNQATQESKDPSQAGGGLTEEDNFSTLYAHEYQNIYEELYKNIPKNQRPKKNDPDPLGSRMNVDLTIRQKLMNHATANMIRYNPDPAVTVLWLRLKEEAKAHPGETDTPIRNYLGAFKFTKEEIDGLIRLPDNEANKEKSTAAAVILMKQKFTIDDTPSPIEGLMGALSQNGLIAPGSPIGAAVGVIGSVTAGGLTTGNSAPGITITPDASLTPPNN